MTLISAAILLFMVMDPFGNIPVFISILDVVPAEKRQKILLRELLIALLVMTIFLLTGPYLLKAFQISEPAISFSGAIILFLIAIKMIFGPTEDIFKGSPEGEPLIVPLAVPSVAGPSAIATMLFIVGQAPARLPEWTLSLLIAWAGTAIILLLANKLSKFLGKKCLSAIVRLSGLLLTAISVEMFLKSLNIVINK